MKSHFVLGICVSLLLGAPLIAANITVTADANDTDGTVVSGTENPRVAITSHAEGDQVSSSQAVIVTAAASHDSGIEKVSLFTRSDQDTKFTWQGAVKSKPYEWNLGNLPAGTYTLLAKAVAGDAHEAKLTISIEVVSSPVNAPSGAASGAYPFTESWLDTRDDINSFGPVPTDPTAGNAPPSIGPNDRIGWSSDGNLNDEDDWAATALGWTVLGKAELQDQFVHFNYNNRLDKTKIAKERQNRESTLTGALVFRFNQTMIFDNQDPVQLEAGIQHVVDQINMSSARSRFFYIQAGPFEVAYRALKRANPDKRKYCILLSHSGINELDNKFPIDVDDPTHVDDLNDPRARGMVDCANPIRPPSGKPSGLGSGYYFTSRQWPSTNRPQFGGKKYTEGWNKIDWMKTSTVDGYRWAYNRFKVAMDAKGCNGLDASDGGICFTLVSGKFDHGVDGGFAKLTDFLDNTLDLPNTPSPTVSSLVLFDLDTNKVVAPITNGTVIDSSSLPSRVSIRAITNPVTIDWVTFEDMDAGTTLIKDAIGSLYTIAENEDGKIAAWAYAEKTYNLKVTPELNGKTGTAYSVSFTIGDGGGSSPADPTVAITSHKEGDNVVVVVNPWDDSGIEKVKLYTKSEQDMTYTYQGEITEIPYKWYLGILPAGTYTMRTTAYAIDGATVIRKATIAVQGGSSVSVMSNANDTVVSNTEKPRVAITSHADGDQVSSSQAVIVTAAALHDSGIEKVSLFTRSDQDATFKWQGAVKTEPYKWNLGILPAGTYKLMAKTVARNGCEAKRIISIEVVSSPVTDVSSTGDLTVEHHGPCRAPFRLRTSITAGKVWPTTTRTKKTRGGNTEPTRALIFGKPATPVAATMSIEPPMVNG